MNPPVVSVRRFDHRHQRRRAAAPGDERHLELDRRRDLVLLRLAALRHARQRLQADPGRTGTTYVQTQADLGFTIRVYVTATSNGGTATAPSDHTYPTRPKLKLKPATTTPPKILDAPAVGAKLRLSDGVWTGDRPMRFTRYWRRCDATGAHCRC